MVLRVLLLALTALFFTVNAAHAESTGISISIDHPSVSAKVGEKIGFDTVIRNDSDRSVSDLVEHLNIASTKPGTYVDPEDWSQDRTQYLTQVPAHATIRTHWTVRAVNDGSFAVYVAAVSPHGDVTSVASSDALRLSASAVTPINPSGALPVVLGTPLLVGAVLAGTRLIQRRNRRSGPARA